MYNIQKISVVAALAALLLVACSEPPAEQDTAAQEPASALDSLLDKKKALANEMVEAMTPDMLSDQARQGGQLFANYCADCHPRRGRGDYLKRIPATLLARRSEAELVKWIRGVDQHRNMPSFTDLQPQQLEALAAYLAAEVTR